MMRALLLVMSLLSYAMGAPAAQTAAQRQEVFRRLPDWTGVWKIDDGVWSEAGLRNGFDAPFTSMLLMKGLPLSAEGQKFLQESYAHTRTGKACTMYFPGVMESPWPFEVLTTPEETAFIFAGLEVRHIYTDGRRHLPDDEIWPTPWGDSVGHWEGDTLVVETIEVAPTYLDTRGAHFSERIRRIDKNRLEDVLTMTSATALTRPFTVTLPYKRMTVVDRLIHGDCMQNDRNPVVDGKDSVSAPAAPVH